MYTRTAGCLWTSTFPFLISILKTFYQFYFEHWIGRPHYPLFSLSSPFPVIHLVLTHPFQLFQSLEAMLLLHPPILGFMSSADLEIYLSAAKLSINHDKLGYKHQYPPYPISHSMLFWGESVASTPCSLLPNSHQFIFHDSTIFMPCWSTY